MFFSLTTVLLAALAADPAILHFEAVENVWDVAEWDCDGDGTSEILAFYCDEKSHPLKKGVHLFRTSTPGRPIATLALDPAISALMLAETDGATPKELVAFDGEGAIIYKFDNDTLVECAKPRFASLLPCGSKEPAILEHLAEDLDGDGVEEWYVPVARGIAIYSPKGTAVTVPCDIVSDIRGGGGGNVFISHRLPDCASFVHPGDAVKGVVCLSDEYADFAYGVNWSEHAQWKIPLNLDEKWESSARLADVNHDGLPDLAVTQTRGTVNLEVQTQIYIAQSACAYPETPSTNLAVKGAYSQPVFKDVDGDKDLDMIVIAIPFGVKNFVNYFVRGKISVDAEVYLFDNGGYGQKPAFTTSLTVDAPEGREQVVHAFGDFNGDGRLDAAFGKAEDKLAVFLGNPKDFLESRPWMTLTVSSFGLARVFHLGGSEAADMVIYHPGMKHSKVIEAILF